MKKIEVKQLFDLSDADIKKIATWIFDEWMDKENHCTFEETMSYIKYGMLKDRIPAMFGIFVNEQLAGVYGFGFDDLTARPDIYPWLQNFYIDKGYRGQGLGRIMLEKVKENASKVTDSPYLYLYTKHSNLYEKFGWEFLGEIDTYSKIPRIERLYRFKLK